MATDLDMPVDLALAPVEYRAISSAAVSSLALGVLSALALLDAWMVVLPIVAAATGAYALAKIRRRPTELTGEPLAKIGLALGLVFFTAGAGWHTYVYATEVPEGYTRISYSQLQPSAPDVIEVPDSAKALDGQKVFLRGYIYPGAQQTGVRTFLLVRDAGDCCFGGNPKLTDRVQVTLADPAGMTWSSRIHKVAGVFRVRPLETAVDGRGGVLYQLEEAILR